MRRLLALPLLAVLLVAGACGGGVSKEEYVAAASAHLGEVDAALASLEATTPQTAAAAVADVQLRLVAAADALTALEPPGALEEAHDALAEGVRALAGEVGGVAALAASGAELAAVLDELAGLPSLVTLAEARELFEREDVELEPAPAPG